MIALTLHSNWGMGLDCASDPSAVAALRSDPHGGPPTLAVHAGLTYGISG